VSIEQLQDPECPVELWWEQAALFPLEAQQSILYPLLTLEDPARWAQMEADNISFWVDQLVRRLSVSAQHLFAADCAEHVLAVFERVYPKDTRPREAIRVRRLFARRKATKEALARAVTAAIDAANNVSFASESAVASYAATAASHLDWCMANATDAAGEASRAERQWQWRRLQEYLRGNL